MIHQPMRHNCNGFKAAVRMARETWYTVAVVHSPAIPKLKILTNITTGERSIRT
jgi:hypothetical protein